MNKKENIIPKEESWIFPSTKEYKLPNGELIGGYFTMQGNIGDIFKYKNDELINTLKYKGPIPYFSIPIGQDLMSKMNANGGKYSGMNKCSLYVPHVCHYSQGCRCYCGHCCSCCTCSHNDLNNPNFPFGLLNKGLNDYFNPQFPLSSKNKQKNQNKFDITGEKGNYHLEYLDKDLYKYKFDITCNQVPIPNGYGDKLDIGDVSIYRDKGHNNSKKITIPSYKPLGDDLLKGILPNFLEKKRQREANIPKKRRNAKNDDEEYKPTEIELKEAQEEVNPLQSRSRRQNNTKNAPSEQISNSKNDNNNNLNNNNNPRSIRSRRGRNDDEEYIPTEKELKEAQEEEKPLEKKGGPFSSNNWSKNNKGNSYQRPTEEPYTRLWEGALKRPNPKIGKALYKGAHVVHTLVEVYDGEKHVFIESGSENGHNILYILDAKTLKGNFFKDYHSVDGSKASLKNITVDQICNNLKYDYGQYEQFSNDCVTVSEEVLKLAGNNNGLIIIEDMKSEYGKIHDKMVEYYNRHPFEACQISPYLEDEDRKNFPWLVRCLAPKKK